MCKEEILEFPACVYEFVSTVYMCAGDDITARPGHVLFKFKQAKGGREGGKRGGVEELEECQTLDWISMNSKEADGGRGGERGVEESGERGERVEGRGKKTYDSGRSYFDSLL